MKTLDVAALSKALVKNKYVLLVLVLGVLLLLLPGEGEDSGSRETGLGTALSASGIPVDTEAERIAQLLSRIRGVGSAAVLLSEEGAVVVCEGWDSPQARLDVTNAVMAYTGLGSDKIKVMKMK